MAKGEDTRNRIMDIAQSAILTKGFEATSIEEIVADAKITKGGFFYHFKDKNKLAAALIERYIAEEDRIFDDIFDRAADLTDDPLQRILIGLKFLADLFDDLEGGHPGCLVATAAYQDRVFDRHVRQLNKQAVLGWRARFAAMLEATGDLYTRSDECGLRDLADMFSTIMEGGIILSKALDDRRIAGRQIMLLRSFVKVMHRPKPQ